VSGEAVAESDVADEGESSAGEVVSN